MNAFYFSNRYTIKAIKEEEAFFTLSYLVAYQIEFISVSGFYMQMYSRIDKIHLNWVIFLMEFLLTDDPQETKDWIRHTLNMKKILDRNSKKHPSKEILAIKNKYYLWLTNMRAMLKLKLSEFLSAAGFMPFFELMEEHIIITNYKMIYNLDEKSEDITMNEMLNILSIHVGTPILNDDYMKQNEIKDISLINIEGLEKYNNIYITLFTIPFSYKSTDTSELLINTRNQLIEKYWKIDMEINTFIKENSFKQIDKTLKISFKDLYDRCKPLLIEFQKEVDNDIYFKKLINSSQECIKLQLNLCFTSLNKIIDHYEKEDLLEPYLIRSLKDKLELKFDLSSSKFFYFIDIIEPESN